MPPLPKRKWLQRNPGGKYRNYRRAYARHQRQRGGGGPFAPLSEQEILRRAQADVVPSITAAGTALTEALLGRATRSVNEINTRTGSIASALRPFHASAGSIYGQQRGNEAALGNAIRASLAGTGQAIGADIEAQLAGIQAPGAAVSQYAGGAAQMGAGAGGAVGGLSSAELQRLQSAGTAEQVYAGALPRLAELAGAQERRGILRELGGELTDKMAELYAQQPELLANAVAGYRKDELDKELAREATRGKSKLLGIEAKQKQRELRARARQEAAEDKRQAQREKAKDQRRAQLEAQKDARRAAREAEKDARTAAREAARDARRAKQEKQETKKGGDAGERRKYFESIREDAFDRAREYAEPKENDVGRMVQLPKETAFQRLWSEYGRLLVQRGYPRAVVEAMLRRALSVAGY